MNDPGTSEPMKEAENDLKKHGPEDPTAEEEEEVLNFLDPSRWWFSSTAAPLIAGTFGPMASAFSICALVQPWREFIPEGGTEAHGNDIKDPAWLITVNSIQLFLAVLANLALLLNMARRLSFAIAQSITIIGWFLSSFLLIALVAVASSPSSGFRQNPPERHALTQAFYYGIMAAVLYFVISCLMVVTVYGAYRDHYPKQFRLTVAQRTLMLQTIAFMMYILIGALVFKTIEGWTFLDAVYWANFTLLTIGIGSDFVPKTHTGRSLLFPYAIGGIVSVGLVIGSIRSMVLERGKEKMQARFVEKKREKALSSVNLEERTITISWFKKYSFSEDGLSEPERREQEFRIMRKIQTEAHIRQKYVALSMSLMSAMSLWFLGALIFFYAEAPQGWSYFTALYFSFTSLVTIGYGDLQPTSNSGKPFFVLWTLLAVPTLTIFISHLGDTAIKAFADLTIWAGSLTVLPGDNSFQENLKAATRRFTQGARLNPSELRTDKPPGFISHSDEKSQGAGYHAEDIEQHGLERLAKHVEDEEIQEAKSAEERGDPRERDLHLYHYILVRELKTVMTDMHARPPKQYSYRDWAWFLKLIDQDEGDPDLHRPPPIKPNHTKQVELGKGGSGDQRLKWSWLGVRSPLMGAQAEAEWLAERLGAKLEASLRSIRRGDVSDRVPISLSDLQKRKKEDSAKVKGEGSPEDGEGKDLEKRK